MKFFSLPVAAILMIVGLGTAFSYHLGQVDANQHSMAERARVEVELAAVRAGLDGQIKATFGITQGLVDIIGLQGGILPNMFAQMADLAMEKSPHIRNIAVAPNDVITDIHPAEGNEKALGLDYSTIPVQYQSVRRARELRTPVLSDPVNLVQGGQGLIQRAPVFRHRSGESGPPPYWGVVSVVARADSLLAEAGVVTSESLAIALLRVDEANGFLITGDGSVLRKTPVVLDLAVPGGTWRLAAMPKTGWLTPNPLLSLHFQFGLAVTLLISVIASILLSNSRKLHRQNASLIQEVRERKRAEEGLRLAAAVYKSTDQGIVVANARGDILSVNRAFTEITGYVAMEVEGKSFRILRGESQSPLSFMAMWGELEKKGVWQGELNCRRKSGEEFPCWATVSAIDGLSDKQVEYAIVMSDISPLMRSQNQLEHMAHYDPLTGLPNRLLFHDRLTHALKQRNIGHSLTGLLLLDLDGFKVVNDSHGHPVGDKLLQAVATRLQSCVRPEDTVARLGGDEFALILERVKHPEAIASVANKILASIRAPFDLDGIHAEISTSIGIAFYPTDAEDTVDLIRNADTAMYGAKEQGRNKYRFYQASMTQIMHSKLEMERALRKGMENAEFEVWYQPQISLHNGEMTGAEALLRWNRKNIGMISPAEFIPLAERSGLIVPLGEFVLEQVCRDGKAWLEAGINFGKLAVNVATPQIERSDFVSALRRILAQTGFAANYLEIEVTESVIMASADDAKRTMNAIQKMGISTAIDDFGTGYSSLAYLKDLPIDNLKIDRAFIKDLPENPEDATITRAIINMGHNLGFRVIAEGIENEAQWQFLKEEGCDEIQGYWVGRPMPANTFITWVRGRVR